MTHVNNCADYLEACSPAKMAALKFQFLSHEITLATRADLLLVFQTETLRKKIFPDDAIVVETCVYEPNEVNLDILLDPNVTCTMYMTKGDSSDIESMSLGFKCSCELGLRYDVNYYGPDNNISLVTSHFVQHFSAIAKDHSDLRGLWINVLVPKTLLKKGGLQKLLDHRQSMGLVIAEAFDREQIVKQRPITDYDNKSRM